MRTPSTAILSTRVDPHALDGDRLPVHADPAGLDHVLADTPGATPARARTFCSRSPWRSSSARLARGRPGGRGELHVLGPAGSGCRGGLVVGRCNVHRDQSPTVRRLGPTRPGSAAGPPKVSEIAEVRASVSWFPRPADAAPPGDRPDDDRPDERGRHSAGAAPARLDGVPSFVRRAAPPAVEARPRGRRRPARARGRRQAADRLRPGHPGRRTSSRSWTPWSSRAPCWSGRPAAATWRSRWP